MSNLDLHIMRMQCNKFKDIYKLNKKLAQEEGSYGTSGNGFSEFMLDAPIALAKLLEMYKELKEATWNTPGQSKDTWGEVNHKLTLHQAADQSLAFSEMPKVHNLLKRVVKAYDGMEDIFEVCSEIRTYLGIK